MSDLASNVAFRPVSVSRSPWRKRLIRGGLALVVLIAAFVGWLLYDHYVKERALREAEAEADRLDPGWRFHELEAARPPAPPDSENGALQVLAARRLLPRLWPAPPQPGQGRGLEERLGDLPPQVRLDEEQVKELRAALQQAAAALELVHRLADLPRGRYIVAWSEDLISTLLPHLEEARRATVLLSLDAMLQAQEGDADGALASCQAALNAGRSIGDEPTAISQLVRLACRRLAVLSLERALAQGEPSPAALERLQHLLEDEATQPLLLLAARSLRADMHEALKVFKEGRFDRRAWGLRNPAWMPDPAVNLVDASKARASHAAYLRYLNELVEITRLPPEQQPPRLEQLGKPPLDLPQPLSILNEGDDRKMVRASHDNLALLRCAVAALAAERYRREKQHWPDGLAALVPEFLRDVPTDPYDGAPLRYRRLEDGVIIYALGQDGRDDGGNLSRPYQTPAGGTDVCFRLWDVKHRAQPPPIAAGEAKLGP
jgi:hypothetical protein